MKSNLKNFGFKHKTGVIMPISSLPGRYGIGSFGKQAHDFIDFLDATGQKVWQVLPLNPTAYGDSPYQSPASAAGNPYFIDLDILAQQGLLTKEELKGQESYSRKVEYGWLFETRYKALRLAHSRFEENADYKRFVKKNSDWLEKYALFMALKVKNNYSSWNSWCDGERDCRSALASCSVHEEEMSFWRFVQYEFSNQWSAVVKHAHEKGILIIGDIPIYVAHDSVDVWSSPEQFLLDESYDPTVVAGCPPDGFSPDGQLWGNPIYNWKRMEEEKFSWWLERVGYAFRLYDILRIDHFRGFAGYYNIPFGHTTAREGKWDHAPGIALFRRLHEVYPKAKIIAEDLGFITDDVRELLCDAGLPGMKMLQFAFYDEDSEYLPRMYNTDNCVAYVSSHDSDCSTSWIKSLTGDARKRFNRERPKVKGESLTYGFIRLALLSRANLTVTMMQDYLELKNEEGRMNVPSTSKDNWTWRISSKYNTPALRQKMLKLATETKRAK